MSCPQKKPCKPESSFNFLEYLHKARNVSHWLGHFNDPPSPTDKFDDWLMSANLGDPTANGCCGGASGGGSVGQKCPFVNVFLYMMLKARQAAAAMAVIMLSAIVIVLRSTQFISVRWSQTFGAKCTVPGIQMFCVQAAVLFLLTMFVMFTVYWPAYLAFLSITNAMAWVITMTVRRRISIA